MKNKGIGENFEKGIGNRYKKKLKKIKTFFKKIIAQLSY